MGSSPTVIRSRKRLLIALVASGVLVFFALKYWPKLQGRAADLAWVADRLPALHKNLFFQLPEAEYRQALADLRKEVDQLDNEQYFVALCQILARLGDGHTSLNLPYSVSASYGRYPLDLYWFPDGLYVIRAGTESSQLIGLRMVAIDGMPLDEVMKRVSTVVAKENEVSVLARSPALLVRPEVLYGLGVAERKDRATFTFAAADGSELQAELQSSVSKPFTWSSGTTTPPMWWVSNSVIWHRYLEAERTLYIQYNSCQGDLSQATSAVVSVLDANPVERIVFDMRRNGGGNSSVAQKLINTIAARPEVREPGHLFVVVGRDTFSSAILNSYDFRRRTNAIFFGEPTVGKPNSYGEVRAARLPYSGFVMGYSIKYFAMVEGEDPPSFVPDVVVEQSAEDFFAGRDPVFEAILRYEHAGPK